MNIHQQFLFICTSRGWLNVKDGQKYFEELKTNSSGQDSSLTWDSMIAQNNEKLAKFQKKLIVVKFEVNAEEYLVYANLTTKPELQIQKRYKEHDFQYFEALIKAIVESPQYVLRYGQALAVEPTQTAEGPPKRKSVAYSNEKLLSDWIKMGYFYHNDGSIHLGPKTLAEYDTYIQSEFESVPICELCLKLTFKFERCNNCQKVFHKECIKKYLQSRKICPNCKIDWTIPQNEDSN